MTDQAFERFYRETAKRLWGYLLNSTGDASAVDDLLQEAYIALLRSDTDTLNDAERRSYLYKIATNLVYMRWRTMKRKRFWEVRLEHEPKEPQQEQTLDSAVDLHRAFEQLSPQQRSLLWLAHVERYEHHEIASMLGVRQASVKVLLFRARKKLHRILTSMGIRGRSTAV